MLSYLLPALYALFAWWFSTGLVMYLDGLPQRTFRWSMAGATVLLNLSASPITVARAEDRHLLARSASARVARRSSLSSAPRRPASRTWRCA